MKIDEFLKNAKLEEETIGCSDTKVFKVNDKYFLKIGKNLNNEYLKLKYLSDKLPVPKIIIYEKKDKDYLVTSKMPGEMLCSNYYMKNPNIDIIVDAFKLLYKVDISKCLFNTSLDYRLKIAEYNVKNNLVNVDEDKYGSKENILNYLKENKFKEELCFSHGDMSLPNIFAYKNRLSGFIDVGECGISDRWFDIAIAIRSIIRNYGEEYVDIFLNKLGIKFDKFKYEYYMLLMQLML